MENDNRQILQVTVAEWDYSLVTEQCIRWGRNMESRTVAFANVHMLMEAYDDPSFRAELNRMDLVNPDGMPLVWALHALGAENASRVYGPHATQYLLKAAEKADLSVGFYGASEATMAKLIAQVRETYPRLRIDFTFSPPFRALTPGEDHAIVHQIVSSGVRLLFVGLGCPKQERWMAAHRNTIPAVLLGVGAAFDFIAGTKPQAPRWMMRAGFEWFFRLCAEPRRLLGRYLKHNPRFMIRFVLQLLQKDRAQGTILPSS